MSAYVRDDKSFRCQIAARANQLSSARRVLAMARLAAELRDSLTPLQRVQVVTALSSAETLVKVSGLNRSQFNALLVLAHCNGLDDLREFFTGRR
jgi:hypothetical protein